MSAVPEWAEPLVDQVAGDARRVIDAELERLARKSPSLSPREVEIVGKALDELAERLLIRRLVTLAEARPDLWVQATALLASQQKQQRQHAAGDGS
jgi:hypothetical protein